MRNELPTLYKRDTTGKIRQWTVIAEDNKFWSQQGVIGGKIVVNKPTIASLKMLAEAMKQPPKNKRLRKLKQSGKRKSLENILSPLKPPKAKRDFSNQCSQINLMTAKKIWNIQLLLNPS